MAEYLISQRQLLIIHEHLTLKDKIKLAEQNWNSFSKEEKQFVVNCLESLYPQKGRLIKEAWYNTVMDILGIFDPTPVVDIINATSYFIQGDTLFGILSIIGAIPYAGDFVAKPVLGALKIGGPSVKALESAIKMSKGAAVGSKEYVAAGETIAKLAKEPGVIGSFLQKMGGSFGDKVLKTLDEIPAGPFKGLKNTIKSYFQLLSNAGKKSVGFQGLAKGLAADFKAGKAVTADVKALKDLLKAEKVFNPATLAKPGFFTNVFFGGIPRLFRSPSGRRMRILMQSTKWWLGFLDYIGIGNWVGAEEVAKKLGDEEFNKKIEEYNQSPAAKQYFEDQFGKETMETGVGQTSDTTPTTTSTETDKGDPFANFLKKMFMGQINPLPGV